MTHIINIKSGTKYDIYCGRPSVFGNPHIIGFCKLCQRHHDREDCIEVFRQEFTSRINRDKKYKEKIDELKDKILGCFCVPNRCHCEVYVDYFNNSDYYLSQTRNLCIIAGSRHLCDYDLIGETVQASGFKIDEVVCGCAKGIDNNGKIWAEKHNIPVKQFPAKWDDLTIKPCIIKVNKYGKQYNTLAGYNRNKEMVNYATHLILIWDGKSSGSANMKKLAQEKGLIIYEIVICE